MHIVRVPRSGEQRIRIDRSIAAREPGPGPSVTSRSGPRKRTKTSHDWFWALHNPHAAASGRRWSAALASVRERPTPIISRRMLRSIATKFRGQIAEAAQRHKLSEALILAVIAVESAGKPAAKSHAGAQGLMQLIPATARRFGVSNPFDPVENIEGGAAYLAWLLGTFQGDMLLALAGYNAGEGAVLKHKGVPPYRETRDYVVKVLDAIAGAEELCSGGFAGPRRSCLWEAQES